MPEPAPIALAMTGASGAAYGMRLLELLLGADEDVYLMLSAPGRMVIEMELDLRLPARPAEQEALLAEHFDTRPGQLRAFGREDWFAPVASGSSAPRAMVVCPCTTGTLASLAGGQCRTLIERAAEVTLKERRRLILVTRETPYSVIALENMLRLTRAGALLLPANPGFYNRPRAVGDLVDFVVARVLDHLDVAHDLLPRWGEEPRADD